MPISGCATHFIFGDKTPVKVSESTFLDRPALFFKKLSETLGKQNQGMLSLPRF